MDVLTLVLLHEFAHVIAHTIAPIKINGNHHEYHGVYFIRYFLVC